MSWRNFFSPQKFYYSFKYAFSGLRIVFEEEQSFRVQLVLSAVLLFWMFFNQWDFLVKAIVIISMALVLSLELINSQIERTLNLLHPAWHAEVKKIKDIAAAAVLVTTIGAASIFLILWLNQAL